MISSRWPSQDFSVERTNFYKQIQIVCLKQQLKNQNQMGNSSLVEQKLNNPFFATNKQDSEFAEVLSQFKLVSTYEDELFQKCSVIQHKETNELIITKEIDCKDESEMNKVFGQFERRKENLTNQHLLRVRYVLKKKTDGLFNDQYKVLIFFDYVLASSLAEFGNRLKKKQPFTAEQINTIMAGAIRGYAALQEQKVPNDKVRLKNIYFGIKQKAPITKIIDSKLFPTDNNLNTIKNKSGPNDDIFLAPEELKGIKGDKSGVFSLGICMMQLCLLDSCREMYNYVNSSVNYKEIQTRLNIIKNKYPLSVYYLIREMLERNDDTRPSFTKLAQNLPTNLKNLSTALNLSVVNRKTQHLVSPDTGKSRVLPPIGYTKSIAPIPVDPSKRSMHQTSLASEYRPQINSSEIYTNGNMYTGQKRDNLRHGKGKYMYNDGSYYYGDWFKGKMEGQGKLYDPDGNLQYEGQWKDDHYEGKGILHGLGDVGWIRYEGEFKGGKMEGFGEMIFRDGNRYKGQFRADCPWGKGRMFSKQGQVRAGIWEKGQFVKSV